MRGCLSSREGKQEAACKAGRLEGKTAALSSRQRSEGGSPPQLKEQRGGERECSCLFGSCWCRHRGGSGYLPPSEEGEGKKRENQKGVAERHKMGEESVPSPCFPTDAPRCGDSCLENHMFLSDINKERRSSWLLLRHFIQSIHGW